MTAPSKPKLLIVEDDAGLQAQLKWAYEAFEVIQATDREAALRWYVLGRLRLFNRRSRKGTRIIWLAISGWAVTLLS